MTGSSDLCQGYTGSGGGTGAAFDFRRKNPPLLKLCQPVRSQRISDAASQSAHASMKKRYHQIEIESRPGRGSTFPLRG